MKKQSKREKIKRQGGIVAGWLKSHMEKQREKKGFLWIIYSILYRFLDHTIFGRGAELAYYFLFSFMPLIIFFTALLGVMNLDAGQFTDLSQFIPEEVQGFISTFYGYIKSGPTGAMMITGLGLGIYFSSSAIRSLMRSLDTAYEVKKGRNPIFGTILSFLFAVVFLAAIVVVLVLMVGGGAIVDLLLRFWPDLQSFAVVVNILRYAVMILPLLVIFILLYKFTPSHKVKFREAIPGSIFSMLGWVIVSMAFSFYVSHFGRYASLYGSLATIIVLMMWLYLTGVIFILGGELNAVLYKRKVSIREKQMLDDGDDGDSAEPDNIDG